MFKILPTLYHWCCIKATYKVRIEIETKRNLPDETKSNKMKPTEMKRNQIETKPKRNLQKQNEIKLSKMKSSSLIYMHVCVTISILKYIPWLLNMYIYVKVFTSILEVTGYVCSFLDVRICGFTSFLCKTQKIFRL